MYIGYDRSDQYWRSQIIDRQQTGIYQQIGFDTNEEYLLNRMSCTDDSINTVG